MSQREVIFDALKTLLTEIPDFATIRGASSIGDKLPFTLAVAEFPAVQIELIDESVRYESTQQGMNKLSADLYIYCIEWDKFSLTQEEGLLKAVRDKIGANITVSNTAIDISIRSIVKITSEYPLVQFKLNIVILYEKSISNL